jgi:hypothetical protein
MRALSRMLAVAALALAAVAVASAADFTFRVPVALHSIPADVKTLAVTVQVYDATWDPKTPTAVEGHIVAHGSSSSLTIENGEFSDTVSVSFNALYALRRRPEEAVFYRVGLGLYGPPGYQGGCLNAMASDGPYPYDPGQPILCDYFGRIDAPPAPRQVVRAPADLLRRIKR